MKKTISVLLALIFVFGMMQMSMVGASAVEDLVPADGNYEVDVYVQEDLPQDIQALILAHFYGITAYDGEQTRNILCTLFGHKNETSVTISITHNVYTTSPKCVQNTYLTYTCTRCGNVETELTGSERVSTCHG